MKAIGLLKLQESRKIWSKKAAAAHNMKLLTSAEYAASRSYSIRAVQARAQTGRLQAFKEAGKWYIPVPKGS